MNRDPLDWLFSLAQFGIKFGLHNIRAVVSELGHPERQFQSVHVAGTNGKGSVTAIVEAALRQSGLRTGRYTSPHLLNLTERFAVNGDPVSEADLRESVAMVRDAVERLQSRGSLDVHPTFFEVTTAVAFDLFRRHGVEVAVCEVGLGGRLDATNVLSPMACAITSIALDHEQYLGRTLAEIAAEKAGVIKPGVPVVVGPVASSAAERIAATAADAGAPLVWAMADCEVTEGTVQPDGSQSFVLRTPRRDYGSLHLGLAGTHQITNAVVAVRLLEQLEALGRAVGETAIRQALGSVRWPGRLERIRLGDDREILLDAAHNPAGAAALARYLVSIGPPRPLVFAAMRDKDLTGMIAELAPVVSRVIATRASNPRSAEPADVAATIQSIAPALDVETAVSPAEALVRAWELGDKIVAAGSIFLLADVMKELGRS